jgi:hypothetical protein
MHWFVFEAIIMLLLWEVGSRLVYVSLEMMGLRYTFGICIAQSGYFVEMKKDAKLFVEEI